MRTDSLPLPVLHFLFLRLNLMPKGLNLCKKNHSSWQNLTYSFLEDGVISIIHSQVAELVILLLY